MFVFLPENSSFRVQRGNQPAPATAGALPVPARPRRCAVTAAAWCSGIVLLGLTLGAGIVSAQTSGATQASNPVVITVGTQQIHAHQFEQILNGLPAEQRAVVMAHKREVAQEYARMLVMTQAAEKRGLDHSPEFLFEMEMVRNKALATELIDALRKESTPTPAQIQAYYTAHPQEFLQVKARHILVTDSDTPGGVSKRTPAEAEAKIQKIAAQLKGGADFATLAKQDSDDPGSKAKGGELGYVSYGQTVPEFQKVLFALPVGQTSAPFQTRFGYHIVQAEAHRQMPLAQATPQITEKLTTEMVRARITAIEKSTPVVLNNSYFGPPAPAAKPAPAAPAKP